MSTAELKLKIFRQVDNLEKSKLEDIYGVIKNHLNSERDLAEWKTLSDEQRQGLLDAIKDIEKGNGIPHKKVLAKARKKYKNA